MERIKLSKSFPVEEAIEIIVDGHPRHICPDCVWHEQDDIDLVQDCKNTFTKDGENVGQCCCYSVAHGLR